MTTNGASAAFPCLGRSYLSAGRAEVDAPIELTIECDGGPSGDCGWHVVIERQPYERPDGAWDIDITSDVFLPLHRAHLSHRASAAKPDPSSSVSGQRTEDDKR